MCLIRELDLFSIFVPFFGGASYTRVRLIHANIRYFILYGSTLVAYLPNTRPKQQV